MPSTIPAAVAVRPNSAANALAKTTTRNVVLNSGDDPRPSRATKTDAKPAGSNPHIASQNLPNQRAAEQPSSQATVPSTAAASAAAPSLSAALVPTLDRPGDFSMDTPGVSPSTKPEFSSPPSQDAAVPIAADGASSAPQPRDAIAKNILSAVSGTVPVLADVIPELTEQAANAVTDNAVSDAATSSAASFVTSLAPFPAATLPETFPELSAAQPKAKLPAAIPSAKSTPNDATTIGANPRVVSNSTQPMATTQPLSANANSPLKHSLLTSSPTTSRETRSSPRDDNASRGGNSSAARQNSRSADSSDEQDFSTSPAPAIHAQASSLTTYQSTELQSAALHSAGLPNIEAQSTGAQTPGIPSVAVTTVASAVLPAPAQVSSLASTPQQLPPSAAFTPARMVDSAQLQVRGNNSELKISVQLPELGKVEVRAVTAHDVTTAHLTASHADALQFLSAGRATLEQALKSRDVILGSLDSRANDSHGHGQPGADRRQHSPQSSSHSSAGAPSTASVATASVPADAGASGLLPDYSSISVRV
jgi:hypothetical protein